MYALFAARQTLTINLKNRFFKILAPAAICWCLFCIQACNKTVIYDKNLLTKDDNLNLAKDTLHLKVTSVFEKPLITSGSAVGVLGSMYDPSFGTTSAGFYAQCQITSSAISFGANPVLDSAVLTLAYNSPSNYGPCTLPVDLSVYELNQDMYLSSTYHSNDAFQVKTPPIGKLQHFIPDFVDSVPVQGGSVGAEIRIKLDTAFGSKILRADANALSSSSSFLSFFKGIYVTTNSTTVGNGMVFLYLPSSLSGITLYYHNDSITYTVPYTLPISGVTVNHFDNSYQGSAVYSAINSPNATNSQQVYVQAGAGVKGKIIISDLDSLARKLGLSHTDSLAYKIAINKAEIIFTETPTGNNYPIPTSLNLFRIDDAGDPQFLEDQGTNTSSGSLVTETVDGVSYNRYHFILTRYLQRLIQGVHTNNGFYLQSTAGSTTSERVVLGNSTTDKNYQISLVVTYTKL